MGIEMDNFPAELMLLDRNTAGFQNNYEHRDAAVFLRDFGKAAGNQRDAAVFLLDFGNTAGNGRTSRALK